MIVSLQRSTQLMWPAVRWPPLTTPGSHAAYNTILKAQLLSCFVIVVFFFLISDAGAEAQNVYDNFIGTA